MGGKVGVNVGKPGEGKEVTLSRAKNDIEVSTEIPFSKRWVLQLGMCVLLWSSVLLLAPCSPTSNFQLEAYVCFLVTLFSLSVFIRIFGLVGAASAI